MCDEEVPWDAVSTAVEACCDKKLSSAALLHLPPIMERLTYDISCTLGKEPEEGHKANLLISCCKRLLKMAPHHNHPRIERDVPQRHIIQ